MKQINDLSKGFLLRKMFFGLLTTVMVMSLTVGLSACSEGVAQTRQVQSNVGNRIPDGTYVWGESSLTFSGNRIFMDGYISVGISHETMEVRISPTDPYNAWKAEYYYIVRDNILVLHNRFGARNLMYILDGNRLIIYPSARTGSGDGAKAGFSNVGTVFTRK